MKIEIDPFAIRLLQYFNILGAVFGRPISGFRNELDGTDLRKDRLETILECDKPISVVAEYVVQAQRETVAVRTFDAWMLADEAALTVVLSQQVNQQPVPERLPRPKTVCADILKAAGSSMPLSDLYAAVAAEADLDVLETRCPRGFAPFAARVRELQK